MPLTADGDRLERVFAGIERLDGVPDGGIPRHSAAFAAGKTILTQQVVAVGAPLDLAGGQSAATGWA